MVFYRFQFRLDQEDPRWNKRITNIRHLTADIPAAKLYFAADNGIYSMDMNGKNLVKVRCLMISPVGGMAKDIAVSARGLWFDAWAGEVAHTVANSSPPLPRFFRVVLASCFAAEMDPTTRLHTSA